MPDQLQLRGGTTTEHNSFTGAAREVTVDTTKKTLVVHDGSTAGGTPLMKDSGATIAGNITFGANNGTRLSILDGMVSSRVDIGIARTAGGYTFREVNEGSERAGIHSNASNDLIFKTGSAATVMTLDGANLGIGTSTPNSIFHVQPLNETNFLIRNEGSIIVLASETNNGRDSNRGMDFEASFYRFIVSGSEKIAINSSGNVGIGSDAPTAKLDIARLGAAWTGSSPVSGTALHMHNGNNATTSPVYLGLGAGSQSMSGINFGDENDADAGRILYSHSDNSLRFGTNGSSERIRIDTDGNMGFNTTTVQAKLHIKSTLSDTNALVKLESYHPKIRFHDLSGSARGGEILMDGDALRFNVSVPVDDATALSEQMRLDSSGQLGIGLTSGISEKLHVSGNILATGTITPNSDIAFKKDIKPLTNVLEKVTQLLGINFTYKNNNEKSMGLLAQDVERIFPELIRGEEGNKSLNYMGFTGALVEAIKELSNKVEALEKA